MQEQKAKEEDIEIKHPQPRLPLEKTLIGVLASHDDEIINKNLVDFLNHIVQVDDGRLQDFAFVFTGGTFDRVILGTPDPISKISVDPITSGTRSFLLDKCGVIRLPQGRDGGVVILTYLAIKRIVSIIWSFITPQTTHLLKPDNLSLMRLSDIWSVKRLMNTGSISEWYWKESRKDKKFNLQKFPFDLELKSDIKKARKVQSIEWLSKKIEVEYDLTLNIPKRKLIIKVLPKGIDKPNLISPKSYYELEHPFIPLELKDKQLPDANSDVPKTIALIAHDNMKDRMVEFATHYEKELSENFEQILTTGTTGKTILDAAPKLKEIVRCHTGPKGGDIEIATEVLYGKCESVIFFIDPLNIHPHIDDIRVVFFTCAIKDNVRMFSNETHAREWFETVIRRRE